MSEIKFGIQEYIVSPLWHAGVVVSVKFGPGHLKGWVQEPSQISKFGQMSWYCGGFSPHRGDSIQQMRAKFGERSTP